MITAENEKKLSEMLKKVFPGIPVKNNNKAGGGVYTAKIKVDGLNNFRLQAVTDLVAAISCRVEIVCAEFQMCITFS